MECAVSYMCQLHTIISLLRLQKAEYSNPMEAYREGRLSAFFADEPAFQESVQPLPYPDPDDFYQGDEPSYDPRDTVTEQPNFQVKDLPEIHHAYESLLSTDGKFLARGIAE